ncbi:MAG TPA: hypothetical protein DCL41_08415 [Bdellovibrionales bacterium]|nr:hypothetical protein [Pseudobdellovibrionaceae bacterium]HAG91880.1 hypothetical protein [Bdellovibrionales bacterium]|tara:strand:+ start:1469 stop:1840 length:372 start_codon:yes stop_codon:yes gene_type:complete
MNIKGFFTNPIPLVRSADKVGENKMKMQESADRDADGRRQGEEKEEKRHLSEDEFKKAISELEKHPGLIANNLTIKIEDKEDHKVVLIVDIHNQVVRRLSESQLWSAIQAFDRKTGSILDKAM